MILAALLLLATSCTPTRTCTSPSDTNCATPTPVVKFVASTASDLSGHALYWREPGGQFQLLTLLPCEWLDLDEDPTTPATRSCRGADFGVPIQRYCPGCLPKFGYEYAVKSYDFEGNFSSTFSNVVYICTPPICVKPGPCN